MTWGDHEPYPFAVASLNRDLLTYKAALSLALMSELAYRDSVTVEQALDLQGMESHTLDVKDTQGFLAMDQDVCVLSFRGTEKNFGDWLSDLNARPVDDPLGMGIVHRGFQKALEDVWESLVVPELEGAGERRVWFTGHSLGGALAALAASRLPEVLPNLRLAGVVTFGQPRVGWKCFQERLDAYCGERFYRFVNHRDIVPRVPPGYSHVGSPPIQFDGKGEVIGGHEIEAERASEDCLVEPSPTPEALPLSKLEFEEFRRRLVILPEEASAENPLGEGEEEIFSLESGFFPSIADHGLTNGYLPAIAKQIPGIRSV